MLRKKRIPASIKQSVDDCLKTPDEGLLESKLTHSTATLFFKFSFLTNTEINQ